MANKQIYQLDDIGTYTNIDDGDFLLISDTSDGNKDKKVSILNILKKILGNRAFGGSGAIVTADASSQTMSNKRIDNINAAMVTNIYHYGVDITISGPGGYIISHNDLLTNAGLSSSIYAISYVGILISIYKKSAANTYLQQNPDETSDRVTITKTTHAISGQKKLDKIRLKYDIGDNILISIIYRAIPVTGA